MTADSHEEGPPIRVLVVEDDSPLRDSIVDVLELEGFEVHASATVGEALEAARDRRFAAAVVDLRLPDGDGGALTDRLLAEYPDLRIVIHTAFGSLEAAVRALNAGVFAFVEKASDPSELVRRVHGAVNAHFKSYAADLESAVEARTRELRAKNRSLQAQIDARQRSERRYAALVESAPICIHEIGLDGRVTAMNGAGLRMLGLECESDVCGARYLDLVSEEDRPEIQRLLDACCAGEASRFVLRIGEGADQRVFQSSLVPIRDPEGRVARLMGHTEDITERLRTEERQAELTEQLRQSQKLEAVGALAAGVAHDFNNVMTVIQGYADLLRRTWPGDGTVQSAVSGVETACEQAVSLTRSLLSFSGNDASDKETVDLWEVVTESTKLLRHMLPASIRIEVGTPPAPRVWTRVNRAHFSQILLNLAANGRDAMPTGGRLELRVRREADRAVVEVADDGVGMSEEVRGRVFEPFFTTKDREKGTGLGMAVVHGIVSEHGGTIAVDSAPGEGTRVRIVLPACEPALAPVEVRPVPEPARGGGRRVLVVEDDPLVRTLVTSLLERCGFEVVGADDGLAGLDLFGSRGPFDLVFLDEDMPRLTGSECIARIRADHPAVPAILTSGLQNLQRHEPCEHTVVLQKPFRVSQLHEAVAAACGFEPRPAS